MAWTTCSSLVFELRVPLPDVVAMQTRQPNLEGAGEIPLRRLVKEALRMRPSRIVVGEVRQEECLDLLIALNSGLPGMCTLGRTREPRRRRAAPLPGARGARGDRRGSIRPVALTCRSGLSHAAHGRRSTSRRPDPRYRRTAGVASRRARVRARVGPMLPIGIPSLALISR